ncbi:MAG: DsbC family protein, partial [Thiohalophilus sp.]
KGLYQVTVPPQVFYVSPDARYVFDGDVIDMQDRRNLTQEYRDKAALAAVEEVGEESMIIFAPDKPEHTVTVFTDIDCGYCRKLHEHIDEYNKLGIAIRYLSFPRAGLNSPSYQKAVSVWCADDRKQAITDAKQGKPVPNKTCENPVADEYKLGQRIGVTGTPALLLETGELIPGYIPPKRLAAMLNKEPLANGN